MRSEGGWYSLKTEYPKLGFREKIMSQVDLLQNSAVTPEGFWKDK